MCVYDELITGGTTGRVNWLQLHLQQHLVFIPEEGVADIFIDLQLLQINDVSDHSVCNFSIIDLDVLYHLLLKVLFGEPFVIRTVHILNSLVLDNSGSQLLKIARIKLSVYK